MILKGLEELKSFLDTSRNIVIVGHRNPDGDAMGSTLALKHYLDKKGHNATVVVPNEYPEFLHWLPGSETTYRFDWQNNQSQKAIKASDLIFLLDFNTLHRVGTDMQKTLEKYPNDFAMIDHHQQPDDVKYMYSDVTICSTSQMVYQFIEMNADLDLIDADIATCLYTGIMTDTGSFRFRSTTSTTHRIIAALIDKGAKNDKIHNNVYDANSYNRLLLLGQALSNLQILPTYNTAYITLSSEEKKRFDFQKGDTEGVVNYALSLKGIIFAAIFIEDSEQGMVKISFRSKGTFSVNQFSRNHFSGGGHDNAAGGRSDISMAETVTKFVSLLPQYQNELKASYEN
ncbi:MULTISPECIES: bifunctional oligoribonuclease/PAP phosphatase NrnA [unclassified Polaribacter]|uniref:DHH family phosphoesterase n=1 Tax=unclassified Polaribacter TaxID=196858 RepID=UPI001C4ECFFF|nr:MULTISPECIES: bifunctional oligoribonuclease/PAP phosphatase NrnA [unclassified Polaribacter]QXP62368.1 bifunctional oligoribonuclease/PAP phosphatase NrnA [Polaribacter sp. HaHaR_3_91]QXP68117.1 bifunctional oligoribonuclease/PAP phosphatase NrnA [Polaribacter sp. AHE13PA]QXP70295.1 bifunctional oligoribonuclease/PAP phosphatase NrnA [Polaribacter sp. R2A056_3_33]